MFDSDSLSPSEIALLASIKNTPDYSLSEVRFYLSMKKSVHADTETIGV